MAQPCAMHFYNDTLCLIFYKMIHGPPYLRWLKTVSSTFQDLGFDGSLCASLLCLSILHSIIARCHSIIINIDPILIDRLYVSSQKHRWIMTTSDKRWMHEVTKSGVESEPKRGRRSGKMSQWGLSTRKWLNYERALTLLNEAVGILTSPGTTTGTSDDLQPQLSWQSVVTAFTAQDSGISERREMARLFPFYRQGGTVGEKNSSRQPRKRFRSSTLLSEVKYLGN